MLKIDNHIKRSYDSEKRLEIFLLYVYIYIYIYIKKKK